MSEALVYYIDWFPDKPVELRPERVYHIGRGGANEFYLQDVRASREHAMIHWNGGAFVVTDLKSSNGTYVNGERVEERELRPGDQIEIGSRVLAYRVEEADRVEQDFTRQSREVEEWKTVVEMRPTPGGLAGSLQDVPLADVVQILAAGRKTGRLYVTFTGGDGSVYFGDGDVVGADMTRGGDVIADLEAAYALLALDEGVFEFLAQDADFEPRIRESAQSVLLEAARQVDERARSAPGEETIVGPPPLHDG